MSEQTSFLPKLSLAVPRRQLIIILALNALVALGGFFALRLLRSEVPTLLTPGQQVAQEIATAALNSTGVESASGGYVPEQGVVLYTRMAESNPAFVRTWATNQLQLFTSRLDMLPSNETLTWVIDHGRNQEIVSAPLTRASDPTAHRYVSLTNVWREDVVSDSVPAEVAAETAVAETPVEESMPEEAPAVPEEPATDTVIETAPAVGDTAQFAPAVVPAVSVPTQLVSNGFANGAAGWQPLSGNWVVQDGVYLQDDNSGFDLITMLDITPVSNFSIEADLQSLDGELGAGFIYGAPQTDSRAGAQVVDLIDQGSFLRWGYYNEQADYIYEGGVVVEPPIANGDWHKIRLVSNSDETTILLDGQELAVFSDLHNPGFVGLVTSQAQVQFDDVSVIQLPTITDEPVLLTSKAITATFNNGEAPNWTPFAGTWEVVDGVYQQQEIEGFDFGSTADFQGQNYTLTADILYVAGEMGAGFYFNMSQPNSKAGSQMINFTQDGAAIQWGYFNETGEFFFTDFAPVTRTNDNEWHTLQLVVNSGTATILLDGEIIVADINLVYDSGYVGLLSSQSQVSFDNVTIVPENIISTGETTLINRVYDFADGDTSGWLGYAGEWVVSEGVYEQQQRNEWDRVSSLNLRMNGSYSYSADIRYIEGDMNGGLIFNMQQRDDKALAQMVSFTAQGTFLQWGSFSEDGIFNYQNGIPISSVQDGNWHTLAVEVGTNTYSVLLDGVVVAANIPLVYADGFVGLFGGQGWTAYDNVQINGAAQSTSVNSITEEESVENDEAADADADADADAEDESESESEDEPAEDNADSESSEDQPAADQATGDTDLDETDEESTPAEEDEETESANETESSDAP